MTATARDSCLVCGGKSLEPLISIPDVPDAPQGVAASR